VITAAAGRCMRAFPGDARGTRLIADRFGALRRDDILVIARDHIEGDLEAANTVRQATQGVNRWSMTWKTQQRAGSEQQAVIMLYCLCSDHDITNG
jgi:hypothetical protein